METTVPILIALSAAVLLCMGAILDDRRARGRRRAQREEPRALSLLHAINDDRCIGCEACIDVCPTEVLDLVEHKVPRPPVESLAVLLDRPAPRPRSETTTAATPSLRLAERAARIARRSAEQRLDEAQPHPRALDESTSAPSPRKRREPSTRTSAIRRRIPEPTTVEVRSLPVLEREALQLATLRCSDDGATMEIDSLPARERRVLETAVQRCVDDGAAMATGAPPKRKRQTVQLAARTQPEPLTMEFGALPAHEQESLQRAMQRCADDGATMEFDSLPAREREALSIAARLPGDGSTMELSSLEVLEGGVEGGVDDEVFSENSSPHALDNLTEIEMPSLRTLEHSAEISVEIEVLSIDTLDNPTEIEMPSLRTLERAPASPAPLTAMVLPVSPRPGATPPPLPPRPARLPRGSEAFSNRPASVPPPCTDVTSGWEEGATAAHDAWIS